MGQAGHSKTEMGSCAHLLKHLKSLPPLQAPDSLLPCGKTHAGVNRTHGTSCHPSARLTVRRTGPGYRRPVGPQHTRRPAGRKLEEPHTRDQTLPVTLAPHYQPGLAGGKLFLNKIFNIFKFLSTRISRKISIIKHSYPKKTEISRDLY